MPFRVVDRRTGGGSTIFTVHVPDDCPFFEGHFPGHPVLPAIGQLAIVSALLRHDAGSPATLRGADGLRFSCQVSPGDRIEVRLERDGDSAKFEIRTDGALVSRGRVRFTTGPRE